MYLDKCKSYLSCQDPTCFLEHGVDKLESETATTSPTKSSSSSSSSKSISKKYTSETEMGVSMMDVDVESSSGSKVLSTNTGHINVLSSTDTIDDNNKMDKNQHQHHHHPLLSGISMDASELELLQQYPSLVSVIELVTGRFCRCFFLFAKDLIFILTPSLVSILACGGNAYRS
jgi:hypothetical protein